MELLGKRIRVIEHPLAPPDLIGAEGVVIDIRELEPHDDDVAQVRRDDGSAFFVPVAAISVLS